MKDFETRAMEKVKNIWRLYMLNQEPEQLAQALTALPQDIRVIGTGRHEIYEDKQAFLQGMMADQVEARDIDFEILDEWYNVQPVTGDTCVVYGTIWVREKAATGKKVFVEMDSRFSIVCRDGPAGVEICNIHHSMPYLEQKDSEFYPKTLSNLAEEAMRKTAALERRAETDGLTELYNRVAAERYIAEAMAAEPGVFYMLDLDCFKAVNDTLGHPKGDWVIQRFAQLLQDVFGPGAILCRMGGDEFAVWFGRIGREAAEALFASLVERCGALAGAIGVPFCCSAGACEAGPSTEGFAALYQRADQALYQAKARGKGRLEWAQ